MANQSDDDQLGLGSDLLGLMQPQGATPGLSAILMGAPVLAPPATGTQVPVSGLGGALTQLAPAIQTVGDPAQDTSVSLPPMSLTAGSPVQTPPAASVPVTPTSDPMLSHQQRTVYGESSGIYPQEAAKPGKGGIYNPQNWDPGSAQDLQTARAWIAAVRTRNPRVQENGADLNNGIERMVWGKAVDAANAAQALKLPPQVDHFLMRQEGQGAQLPPKDWNNVKLYKSFGPFINTPGGRVAPGPKTYIDFYTTGN